MIRIVILSLVTFWVLLGYFSYPAKSHSTEVSAAKRMTLNQYYSRHKKRAHRGVRKIKTASPVTSPLDPQSTPYRPFQASPVERIEETYRVLNWPKLPRE